MIAKTISGAAELLHVSQPGVSRALKYMEMKLKVELFERRPNGLVPTPEADELYREILPLYRSLDSLDSTINRIVRAERSTVQIGCSPSLAHYLLPEMLARGRKKMPDVIAQVDTLSNEELADYIVDRKGDFALSTYDPKHPLVLAERSISGPIQCVIPKAHKLANAKTVSFAEIADHEVVAYYPDTYIGRIIADQFEALGLTPKISVQVRFNDDACAMAEHGLGIAFAYSFATMESLSPSLKIVPIEDELKPMHIYLLRHQGYSQSSYVRGFYDNMRSDLADLQKSQAA